MHQTSIKLIKCRQAYRLMLPARNCFFEASDCHSNTKVGTNTPFHQGCGKKKGIIGRKSRKARGKSEVVGEWMGSERLRGCFLEVT